MAFAPPQNLPSRSRCSNHPDREGVGICVNCRSVVCVECSTRVDRMNYCFRCLRAATDQFQAPVKENKAREAALGIPLLIGSFLLAVGVFAVLGLLLAMARHWAPGGVSAG